MNDKKQKIIFSLIAIVTLLLVAIGAAYAFFASQNTGKQDVNINAESGTTDVLTFAITDDGNDGINITANMDNFASGLGNEEDIATGTATLIANNATNNAHDNYYVYLKIDINELRYTNFKNAKGEILEGKEENGQIVAPDETHTTKVPELILTVTQPGEDGELKQIDGLDYKTDVDGNGLNGFDITEATGLIPIAKNYEITATGDTPTIKATQNWEIKITLINLDSSQNNNTGKEFSGKLILQKEEYVPTLADLCVGEIASECIPENYKSDKTLIYHNAEAMADSEMVNKELIANDDSYRFSGSSEAVKNYVCLDGTTKKKECGSDADLYRIIGLFKNEDNESLDNGKYEMKLIKATEGTTTELGDNTTAEGGAYSSSYYYYWNSSKGTSSSDGNTNMWQYSNLNKVNLNGYYLNTYLAKVGGLSNHITEHKWVTGGLQWSSLYNVQQIYNRELGTEKLQTGAKNCYDDDYNTGVRTCTDEDVTYHGQIGLMYASDYGYAAYPEAWNTKMGDGGYDQENVKTNNWMLLIKAQWTVSRNSSYGYLAGYINPTGYAGYNNVYNSFTVRPAFYLDSSTKITSGDGSKTNPFRLSWN